MTIITWQLHYMLLFTFSWSKSQF